MDDREKFATSQDLRFTIMLCSFMIETMYKNIPLSIKSFDAEMHNMKHRVLDSKTLYDLYKIIISYDTSPRLYESFDEYKNFYTLISPFDKVYTQPSTVN